MQLLSIVKDVDENKRPVHSTLLSLPQVRTLLSSGVRRAGYILNVCDILLQTKI